MKKLAKINAGLISNLNAFSLKNLSTITGGATQLTAGSTYSRGADGKLKQCDWTDKQDYTVTKDGIIYGEPYGFQSAGCCMPAIINTTDTYTDVTNVNENDAC
jgi:hypothetical protein